MFKAIKQHSFFEFYLLTTGLIALILLAIAGLFYMLGHLPS